MRRKCRFSVNKTFMNSSWNVVTMDGANLDIVLWKSAIDYYNNKRRIKFSQIENHHQLSVCVYLICICTKVWWIMKWISTNKKSLFWYLIKIPKVLSDVLKVSLLPGRSLPLTWTQSVKVLVMFCIWRIWRNISSTPLSLDGSKSCQWMICA